MSNGTHTHINPPEDLEYTQLAPHSREAEEALLGSILINPDYFHDCAAHVGKDDFFMLRNAWIWEAMDRLAKRDEPIEYLMVIEEIKAMGHYDDIGGAAHIAYIANCVGTSVYAETYARVVQSASVRRRLLEAAGEIANTARNENIDTDAAIDRAMELMISASERRKTNVRTLEEGLHSLVAEHADIASGDKEPVVIKTGTKIDSLLSGGGLSPGGVVVTADTSGGKSEFCRQIIENAALQKKHGLVISLEMNEKDVLTNMLSRFSGIPSDFLDTKGKPKDAAQADKYDKAVIKIYEIEPYIHFDDTPMQTIYQIMSSIRKAHREYDISYAVIDYMELIQPGGMDLEKHYMVLGAMFMLLRQLGRTLNIPIITPVQQNRGNYEGVKGVAGSYQISQHADTLIYIKDVNPDRDKEDPIVDKWVSIEKQRRGKRGSKQITLNLATHQILTDDEARTLPGVVDLESVFNDS